MVFSFFKGSKANTNGTIIKNDGEIDDDTDELTIFPAYGTNHPGVSSSSSSITASTKAAAHPASSSSSSSPPSAAAISHHRHSLDFIGKDEDTNNNFENNNNKNDNDNNMEDDQHQHQMIGTLLDRLLVDERHKQSNNNNNKSHHHHHQEGEVVKQQQQQQQQQQDIPLHMYYTRITNPKVYKALYNNNNNEAKVEYLQHETGRSNTLSPECNDCHSPFTLYTRRHLCRVCHELYCNNCTPHFVDYTPNDYDKKQLYECVTLRICRSCYLKVQQQNEGSNNGDASTRASMVEENSCESLVTTPTTDEMNNEGFIKTSASSCNLKSLTTTSSSVKRNYMGQLCTGYLLSLANQLLRQELSYDHNVIQHQDNWANILLTLVTQTVTTVSPDVKNNGDRLDIRPYVKVKIVSGGYRDECAYINGLLFQRNVSHKYMARRVNDPKLMLISGGLDYGLVAHKAQAPNPDGTPATSQRISSLDGYKEAEEAYLKVLIGKIVALKPNVLFVGKVISRKAQEILLQNSIITIQHVKLSTLKKLSRISGAAILPTSNILHLNPKSINMNKVSSPLGDASCFRLVTFRDNDILHSFDTYNRKRNTKQAFELLGDSALDGASCIKSGLAKRGIAKTYVLVEGCPKYLGCSILLRGLVQSSLRKMKKIFLFLTHVAYNLKLETTFLKERCARMPTSYKLDTSKPALSSSLCVDYGQPPPGRRPRPWNGPVDKDQPRVERAEAENSAYLYQSILITSVWMTGKTQCCPAEVKGITYYSSNDVSLGQFLRDSCFDLNLRCQNPTCKKSVLDHNLSFIHNDGKVKITVENMDDPLPPAPLDNKSDQGKSPRAHSSKTKMRDNNPIATWSYCNRCEKVVTPLVYISSETWKFSFGKFLELYFYNKTLELCSSDHNCSICVQNDVTLYFGCGRLAARFTYERVRPYNVFVRKFLPFDYQYHYHDSIKDMNFVSSNASLLFTKFDKQVERISRETRALFGSSANKPEHLQTLISELNNIGSEVDHAAKVLNEKMGSMTTLVSSSSPRAIIEGDAYEMLLNFPNVARRYLFQFFYSWNERLSAIGNALVSMKKLSSTQNKMAMENSGSQDAEALKSLFEDVVNAMKRLKALQDLYKKRNFTFVSGPRGDHEISSVSGVNYNDDEFIANNSEKSHRRRPLSTGQNGAVRKTLGTRRFDDSIDREFFEGEFYTDSKQSRRSLAKTESTSSKNQSPIPLPGGAVKSAINRLFNRSNKVDPYIVDLGDVFGLGRLRMPTGLNGLVIPVIDDEPSSIIAYSLCSGEYNSQFKDFLKADGFLHPFTGSGFFNSENFQKYHARKIRQKNERYNAKYEQQSNDEDLLSSQNSWIVSERRELERRMLTRTKTHIKHSWRDADSKGESLCKIVCTSYWSTQFQAVRQAFMGIDDTASTNSFPKSAKEVELNYVRSLMNSNAWAASGGKSGASFAKTSDGIYVVKSISRTELQMFLDCAPSYFEYMSKAFFHGLPTVLCKILGVYQLGYHNRVTGKRTMEQVAVMQNMFYGRKISHLFDLKGSLRGRFTAGVQHQSQSDTEQRSRRTRSNYDGDSDDDSYSDASSSSSSTCPSVNDESEVTTSKGKEANDWNKFRDSNLESNETNQKVTMLDGDFLEFTSGDPLPLNDRAKALFHMSILNDTLFLSIINVLDYSILVGIDSERNELVVGIIDFMRQYDILKQMERVGKSIPMVVGSEAPTIIQPPLYKQRFTNAMERYFMTVPNKWTDI